MQAGASESFSHYENAYRSSRLVEVSRTCRARFPADQGSLYAAAESRQLSRILALLGGPRAARGRLRRRPPSAAAALRAVGLASLGLAELRKCLIHGKQRSMQSRQGGQCRQGRQGRQGCRQGRRARRMGFQASSTKVVQNCPFGIKFLYVLQGLSNSDSGGVTLLFIRSSEMRSRLTPVVLNA